MQTAHQLRIEEFMRKAQQEPPESPIIPSEEVRRLRAKLILEEAVETIQALGYMVVLVARGSGRLRPLGLDELSVEFPHSKPNLIQIADGCADLSVVTIGTLTACGIKDQKLLEEVDHNNLAKFGPGHKLREDGKVVKPPGHRPPDIERVLREQGYGTSPADETKETRYSRQDGFRCRRCGQVTQPVYQGNVLISHHCGTCNEDFVT